ncbi:unnamed protein product [Haemonchus placei]|uniref:Telomere_reg-2 domain-containing protein n=1 Tax=Haemonchus placei TaxID=6290 RepID=A0A0N4W521_HAEPC|nr:unnamed protein product [Haemonchus placei]
MLATSKISQRLGEADERAVILGILADAKQVSSCVDICFTTANPLHAIPVLVSALSSPDVVDRIIYWLTLSMREHLDDTLKDSIKTGIDDFLYNTYSEFVTSIVFLREKLLNATNRNKGQFKTPESLRIIEGSLCSALTSSLQHVYDSVVAEKDVDLRVLALLIAKSRTIVVMESTLLRYVVKWLCSREESAIWDRIAQRIFTDDSIPTRDAEALVIEAALSASKTEDLMAAISIWSDVSHVRYVAVEQQMHLTRVILALGRWINGMSASHVWKELFDIAIKGVELRLGNPDVVIRQSGMFVGEAFSGWMGGERLEFEYTEDPWLEEMRRLRDGATKPSEETISEEVSPSPECADVQLPSSSSAVTETQAVDSDDEEDFPAYEVPESEKQFEVLSEGAEPERKAPTPYYIRDCYEQLSEKEKYEVFEAAFFALNGMIRRKAIGFNDIAQNLAKKLVFLEDKFSTKNFERSRNEDAVKDIRKQCLISCLVMRPEIAPKLGDMVFSRSCAFFHRYLILECFVAAAKELSEFPNEPATKKVVELPKKNKEQDPNDWRAVVEARIRSHTRRFTSEKKPEVVAPSRFAPVATLFFYPLLRTQTEEHLELKGRDSPFLARLIFTVSDILQKATNAPTVVKMAISLADIVAPLKFHPDAFIRSSVLFAYFSIAVAVPDGVFYELFEEQVRGWIEWTTMCADDVDASEQQRNLARAVMTILLQKLNATNTIEESHS